MPFMAACLKVTVYQVSKLNMIRKRADFLRAAKADYKAVRGLVLQAHKRNDDEAYRIGFTVTKKVGNAVTRNRVRRRLRHAAQAELQKAARPGFDYVVIGRKSSIDRNFKSLCGDLAYALGKIHMRATTKKGVEKGEGSRQDE